MTFMPDGNSSQERIPHEEQERKYVDQRTRLASASRRELQHRIRDETERDAHRLVTPGRSEVDLLRAQRRQRLVAKNVEAGEDANSADENSRQRDSANVFA